MIKESMNTVPLPMKMSSAIVSLGQHSPGWTLANIDEKSARQSRRFVSKVVFESPFCYIPVVHVGIAGFDIDHRDSARVSVSAAAISANGFNIVLQTWQNSCIYKVEVSWLALGQ